jgi:hypothetical protein
VLVQKERGEVFEDLLPFLAFKVVYEARLPRAFRAPGVDDGFVEVFFSGEVLEDDGLADPAFLAISRVVVPLKPF